MQQPADDPGRQLLGKIGAGTVRGGINAPISRALYLLAQAPDGITAKAAERMTGIEEITVCRRLTSMSDRGVIFKVKVRGERVRYFATQGARDAWRKRVDPDWSGVTRDHAPLVLTPIGEHIDKTPKAGQAPPRNLSPRQAKKPKKWVDDMVRVRPVPQTLGDAHVPEGVKHTVQLMPAYDLRYGVDPTSKPYGCGFAAVGPGRDIETGRAWG